jgi:hypothetical protein
MLSFKLQARVDVTADLWIPHQANDTRILCNQIHKPIATWKNIIVTVTRHETALTIDEHVGIDELHVW